MNTGKGRWPGVCLWQSSHAAHASNQTLLSVTAANQVCLQSLLCAAMSLFVTYRGLSLVRCVEGSWASGDA